MPDMIGDGTQGPRGTYKDTYTTREVAKILRVADRTVRNMCDRGELACEREESGTWRVAQHSVHAKLEELREEGAVDSPQEPLEDSERLRELEAEVRDLSYRLGRSEARVELTEKAESTRREERERLLADLDRERARADRLERELNEKRSKSLWQRVFGS